MGATEAAGVAETVSVLINRRHWLVLAATRGAAARVHGIAADIGVWSCGRRYKRWMLKKFGVAYISLLRIGCDIHELQRPFSLINRISFVSSNVGIMSTNLLKFIICRFIVIRSVHAALK